MFPFFKIKFAYLYSIHISMKKEEKRIINKYKFSVGIK